MIIVEYSEEFEKKFNYSFTEFLEILKRLNYKIEKKINEANYLIVYDGNFINNIINEKILKIICYTYH